MLNNHRVNYSFFRISWENEGSENFPDLPTTAYTNGPTVRETCPSLSVYKTKWLYHGKNDGNVWVISASLYTNGYTNGRIFGKMIQRMSVNHQILGTCLFHKRIRTYAQHVQTCSNMLLMLNANALSPPKNSMTSADAKPLNDLREDPQASLHLLIWLSRGYLWCLRRQLGHHPLLKYPPVIPSTWGVYYLGGFSIRRKGFIKLGKPPINWDFSGTMICKWRIFQCHVWVPENIFQRLDYGHLKDS